MPYICLRRSDIPDGTIQILDLMPDASQRNPIYDPPAQTRYVNRVQNDSVKLVAGISRGGNRYGLAAYIADCVDPGGLSYATTNMDLDSVVATDTFTLGGVVFTATDTFPPDPGSQEFLSLAGAGGDHLVMAQSLIDAINDPASEALLLAAGSTITATAGASIGAGNITLTAVTAGRLGALSLAESTVDARIHITGTYLARAFQIFTYAQINLIAAGIITRMDSTLPLTTTAINTLINAVPGVSNTSITSASSHATLAGILSILAGRGYLLPDNSAINVSSLWHAAPAGGFEIIGVKNDSQMVGGEWRPYNIGGDPNPMEVKGITSTHHTSQLDISILEGSLSKFGSSVSLWPESEHMPHFPWNFQGGLTYTPTSAKVITVYDDDGTVLI